MMNYIIINSRGRLVAIERILYLCTMYLYYLAALASQLHITKS